MRPVSVHLDDATGTAFERDREPIDVGLAEALFPGAVLDLDEWVLGGQAICQVPCPVRRRVIDDQQVRARQRGEDGGGNAVEVLGFVVRG